MSIRPPLVGQHLMLHIFPPLSLEVGWNIIRVDLRPQFRNIYRKSQEPPLSNQAQVKLWRQKWQQYSNGMAGSENMADEEVVGMRARGYRPNKQRHCCFLRLLELFYRVGELPGIP